MFLLIKKIIASTSIAVLLSGCATIGPNTISPDRQQYVSEIGESAKEQVLLNIVKMRYFDTPTFLDVSSIINQYGLEQSVGLSGAVNYPRVPADWWNIGGSGSVTYSDKPTITYTPMTGKKFTQNLLTPIPPDAVVGLIQNGWPADLVLKITLNSINGVNNYNAFLGYSKDNENFERLTEFLRDLQSAGVSDIRAESIAQRGSEVSIIFDPSRADEKALSSIGALLDILKVKPGLPKYRFVYGRLPGADGEIALSTRSMMAIMLQYGAGIEVPENHIREGRARPIISAGNAQGKELVRIHSGPGKPSDAFASIVYRGTRFWIDDRDLESKKNFTLLMIFLALTEVEQKAAGPLVTVGA